MSKDQQLLSQGTTRICDGAWCVGPQVSQNQRDLGHPDHFVRLGHAAACLRGKSRRRT